MYKTWFMGTLDSVTCTSAIFAWWKVRGSKFAQPPDGGVFGSGVLRRAWYVTRTACLTRILTRTAQAVSERARQSTSQRRRRRASRAPVTVEDAVGMNEADEFGVLSVSPKAIGCHIPCGFTYASL